jgi:hypothetical protein
MGSRTLTLLLGACALALGVSARASVFFPVDFDTLARRADLIVRGTVQSSSSALTPDGKQVHTVTRIAVGRTLKGSAPVVVEVRTPGGSVGDFSQKISGAPEFTPGEEVIVFLRRHGDSGRYGVDSFSLGKFNLSIDQGRRLVTQHVAGVGLQMPDGQIRAPAEFQPVHEEEFVRRVQKALGDKATP